MQVLLVNPSQESLPNDTIDVLVDIGWQVTTANDYDDAIEVARDGVVDAVILADPPPDAETGARSARLEHLIRHLETQRIATLLLTDSPQQRRTETGPLTEVVSRDISLAELRGRFAMIERYSQLLRQTQEQLQHMQQLGERLNQHFREMDEEMRLAGRLQRDFLPRVEHPIGNVRFSTLYRPATWVSGDMFDILRIDEHHTGIYLADAVGHGVAAGLLTMFIKRAIAPERIDGNGRSITTPSQILATLNDALVEQSLPHCQFVTACYALLDHRTLKLQFARGGHPYPIIIRNGGRIEDLEAPGGLLGLSAGEEFPTVEIQLTPGDKILFFTDGVELAFQSGPDDPIDAHAYRKVFESLSSLPIQEMTARIEAMLDRETGSLHPRDDVTIVALEILRD
ncbi:MAG: PP2C family protein-serine/threonine phosphatase [Planctomycetes bacterium]|nr:PP2C family protein-serine/threonine phosphatase [Planctomycetota bacterium]